MPEKTKTQKAASKRLFEVERRKDYFNLGVLIFTLGSVFGTYYEQIFMYVTLYIHQGIKLWLPRSGLIYGPLSPIYGAGALLVFIMICRWRSKRWYEYFVYGFFNFFEEKAVFPSKLTPTRQMELPSLITKVTAIPVGVSSEMCETFTDGKPLSRYASLMARSSNKASDSE